jgi:hypothetical protein
MQSSDLTPQKQYTAKVNLRRKSSELAQNTKNEPLALTAPP